MATADSTAATADPAAREESFFNFVIKVIQKFHTLWYEIHFENTTEKILKIKKF